jgi:hypothetical protein
VASAPGSLGCQNLSPLRPTSRRQLTHGCLTGASPLPAVAAHLSGITPPVLPSVVLFIQSITILNLAVPPRLTTSSLLPPRLPLKQMAVLQT